MTIVHIHLNLIKPNPYQPRLHEVPEKVAALKASLLANYEVLPKPHRGLYQIPLARVIDDQSIVLRGANSHELQSYVEAGEAVVQLAFGHRRFAAFQLLAGGAIGKPPDERFNQMPVELASLTDRQMAELAARENIERVDLSWYERAHAMNRFIADFGVNQAEVAPLFGLSDKSGVSQYVRALEALRTFNHVDLSHWSEAGLLPLLHVLHLIPLLRDKPVEARQWLAHNPLVNEETGDTVSAVWIKSEVEKFIPPRPQAADPADESKLSWLQFFEQVRQEHPEERVFMQVGNKGAVWVTVGQDAAIVAKQVGARPVLVKTGGQHHPAVAIWMGSPPSEARLQALEAAVGRIHSYQEPSTELHVLISSNIVSRIQPPAPAGEPDSAPAKSSTGAPYPGMPGMPGSSAPEPQPAPPAVQSPKRESTSPAAPAEPAAPAMTEEEREAAAAARMKSIFPGGAPSVRSTVLTLRTSSNPLRDNLNKVGTLLAEALETLAVTATANDLSDTDRVIAEHFQSVAVHTVRAYLNGVENVLVPGALDVMRERVGAADDPRQEMRKAMLALSSVSIQREEKAIG